MKSIISCCCSKAICIGCYFANHKRELKLRLVPSCSFCRTPISYSSEEREKRMMKRIEANDPFATFQEGAAELGFVDAHFHLACLYHFGHGAEKNEGKKTHHLEEAAISGHPMARRNLGLHDKNNGNMERAVKHFIAATLGLDDAIKALMQAFKRGHVSKEDLAAALRAHQDAVDETKSPLRELAGKGLLKHYIIAATQGHDGSIKSLMVAFKAGFVSKDDLAAALRAHQAAEDATKSPQRELAGKIYGV
eukprot:scaffold2153_cov144-Skeletonema_menzelii.AAC.11